MGGEVRQLRGDVVADQSVHPVRGGARGGARVAQPAAYGRYGGEVVAPGEGRHRAAGGVTAHHDVADAQDGDGVLDRGRDTVRSGRVGGHQIARGTDDEQLARFALGDQLGYDAGVGTADEQRLRPVRRRQPGEQVRLRRKDVPLKALYALDEVPHGPYGLHGHSLRWMPPPWG
ncbi:hypothetical protein GCM10020254_76830 [Streptomyces goshikiensis]